MNLIFASVLYAVLAMVGSQVVKPVVGQVRLDSPAAAAGLQRGDEVVRVGDREVNDVEDLQIALIRRFAGDGLVPLTVKVPENDPSDSEMMSVLPLGRLWF